MSAAISSKCGKLKKSKLEKIFELEAELKFTREHNLHLQKELEAKQREGADDSLFPPVSFHEPNVDEMKTMKDAFSALRQVTISQEKNLHEARSEVLQSKKVCKQQESVINTLEKQVKSLEETQKALTTSNESSDSALQAQLEQLQQAFFLEQRKTAELQQHLNERDNAIAVLTARLSASFELVKKGSERSLTTSTHRSEVSFMSMDSVPAGRMVRQGSIKCSGVMRTNSSSRSSLLNRRGSERSLGIISIDSRSGRMKKRGSEISIGSGDLSMDPQSGRLPRQGSQKSLCGMESVHSQHESEILVLQKEVNRKSIRIAELEHQMERMAEEMDELRARVSASGDEGGNEDDDDPFTDEDFQNSTVSFW